MELPEVQVVGSEARKQVLQTLQLAFVGDPMARWLFPAASDFLQYLPDFFDAFGGAAFDHGTAYAVGECKAAALWLPPGVDPDEDRAFSLFAERSAPEKIAALIAFFKQVERYHPKEPCWYLPIIGADPAYTGQGLGAALLKRSLKDCDQGGHVAYLESSNQRNISLYQRHGFEIMGEIQTGDSPTVTPMIRYPRE